MLQILYLSQPSLALQFQGMKLSLACFSWLSITNICCAPLLLSCIHFHVFVSLNYLFAKGDTGDFFFCRCCDLKYFCRYVQPCTYIKWQLCSQDNWNGNVIDSPSHFMLCHEAWSLQINKPKLLWHCIKSTVNQIALPASVAQKRPPTMSHLLICKIYCSIFLFILNVSNVFWLSMQQTGCDAFVCGS